MEVNIDLKDYRPLEIELGSKENFLKIKETLTRIGIANRKEKILYQSCHILHKKGKYYITHFKEMFALDGKKATITEEDVLRRNYIAGLLEDWELLSIVNEDMHIFDEDIKGVYILSYKEKNDWKLEQKYAIGLDKRN